MANRRIKFNQYIYIYIESLRLAALISPSFRPHPLSLSISFWQLQRTNLARDLELNDYLAHALRLCFLMIFAKFVTVFPKSVKLKSRKNTSLSHSLHYGKTKDIRHERTPPHNRY